METKMIQKSEIIVRKENWVGGPILSDFRLYYKVTVTQTV